MTHGTALRQNVASNSTNRILGLLVALAYSFLLADARYASAQNLLVPTIPASTHRDFVHALQIDAGDLALADLAYKAYETDKEKADEIHANRAAWATSFRLDDFHADDQPLISSMMADLSRFTIAWYQAIDEIESRYFAALETLEKGQGGRALSIQREWRRSWLLYSSAIPRDAPSGSTIDMIEVLASMHFNPQTVEALPAVLTAYASEVDASLCRLKKNLMLEREVGDTLHAAATAGYAGDWDTCQRELDAYLEISNAAGRELDGLREVNVRFAKQIDSLLPWRASVDFRARTRARIFPYLFDSAAALPEQRLVEALRSHANASAKELAGLQRVDADYNQKFLGLAVSIDPLYRTLSGAPALEARRRADCLKQFGNKNAAYDEDGPTRDRYERHRKELQALIQDTLRQEAEVIVGLQ